MRYEGKHQIMKRLVHQSNNHNDMKSILMKCLKQLSSVDLSISVCLHGESVLNERELAQVKQDCCRGKSCVVQSYQSLRYKSTKFEIDCFVSTEDEPAILKGIYVFDNDLDSIFCLVKPSCYLPTTEYGYRVLRTYPETNNKYIPVQQLRGKLILIQLKDENLGLIVHSTDVILCQ